MKNSRDCSLNWFLAVYKHFATPQNPEGPGRIMFPRGGCNRVSFLQREVLP